MSMRRIIVVAMLVAALGFVGATVYGAGGKENVGQQWTIALQHSKLSQNYSNSKEIQQHLQHVINCIAGKTGGGFEASAGNPCEGKGAGMMTDAKSAGGKYMANMHWFEVSQQVAMIGMKAKSAQAAKAAAWVTEQALQQTGAVLK